MLTHQVATHLIASHIASFSSTLSAISHRSERHPDTDSYTPCLIPCSQTLRFWELDEAGDLVCQRAIWPKPFHVVESPVVALSTVMTMYAEKQCSLVITGTSSGDLCLWRGNPERDREGPCMVD